MAQPRPEGLIYRIPVIGRIMTDLHRDPDSIFYLIVGIISLVLMGAMQFGLFVLTMAALVMVAVMFTVLILITRG